MRATTQEPPQWPEKSLSLSLSLSLSVPWVSRLHGCLVSRLVYPVVRIGPCWLRVVGGAAAAEEEEAEAAVVVAFYTFHRPVIISKKERESDIVQRSRFRHNIGL